MSRKREEVEFLIKDQLNLTRKGMSRTALMRMSLSISRLTKTISAELSEGEY
jgi:hypothetical protein